MTRASVFTVLLGEVVWGGLSPYHQMLKKIYDIETDYFIMTPHWAEQPPIDLDFQLKDQVIKNFDKLANETLDKELKDKAIGILQESPNEIGDYVWATKNVGYTKQHLHDYFGQIKPCPKIDEAFLQRLYNKAISAFSLESNEQGNTGFNKGFHHALLHNTIWECKGLIERRIIQFIEEVISEAVSKYTTN